MCGERLGNMKVRLGKFVLVLPVVGCLVGGVIVFIVLHTVASERYYTDSSRAFTYLDYTDTAAECNRLASSYPELVEVGSAQDNYGVASPGLCGKISKTDECKQWYIRITNENTYTEPSERPEVFFSGSLHGNERVGPTTVMEFARLLLENYKFGQNPWLKRLVDTRVIYIMPNANALGYDRDTREENHIDPNRDFPYDREANKCMQTTAGRAINELWRDHLFQLSITFHGGMRAIAYEWGSNNHANRNNDVSPDDIGFATICQGMGKYGGNSINTNQQYYPVGVLSDEVYAVGGGMEDWAYAASWDTLDTHKQCTPSTFGGYPLEKTKYSDSMLRVLNVLVETADKKTPYANTLGKVSGIFQPSTVDDGHIARNIRLCLLMSDVVQPYIEWRKPIDIIRGVYGKDDGPIPFAWDVGGAFHVDETALFVMKVSTSTCAQTSEASLLSGGTKHPVTISDHQTFWAKQAQPSSPTVLGRTDTPYSDRFSMTVNPKTLDTGTYVFVAMAVVDSSWKDRRPQSSPPGKAPTSHIVKARTIEGYSASNKQQVIKGKTKWFSKQLCFDIKDGRVEPKNPSSSTNETNGKGQGQETSPVTTPDENMESFFIWTLLIIVATLSTALSVFCLCRWAYHYRTGKFEEEEIIELVGLSGDEDTGSEGRPTYKDGEWVSIGSAGSVDA